MIAEPLFPYFGEEMFGSSSSQEIISSNDVSLAVGQYT